MTMCFLRHRLLTRVTLFRSYSAAEPKLDCNATIACFLLWTPLTSLSDSSEPSNCIQYQVQTEEHQSCINLQNHHYSYHGSLASLIRCQETPPPPYESSLLVVDRIGTCDYLRCIRLVRLSALGIFWGSAQAPNWRIVPEWITATMLSYLDLSLLCASLLMMDWWELFQRKILIL